MKNVVSVVWLSQNLNRKDLVLLNASVIRATSTENSKYKELTIPAARYFDLKADFSDKNSDLPNTILSEAQFEIECRKLGINKTSEIVVFDDLGIYSSPRVWWMFKIMGHEKVSVLDGGLPNWVDQGMKTEKRKIASYPPGNFKASFDANFVIGYSSIQKNIENKTFTLIDARLCRAF